GPGIGFSGRRSRRISRAPMALLAGRTGFLRRKFMRMAACVGGLSAQRGNFALALPIHCRKTAPGANGFDFGGFDDHEILLVLLSGLLNGWDYVAAEHGRGAVAARMDVVLQTGHGKRR